MIVVSNHASVVDGFVLASALMAPAFLAKASLQGLPIYGTILKGLGVDFVDRGDKASRTGAVAALARRGDGHKGRTPIVVFPEGTTNGGGLALKPFRAGAFRPGVPVRPVAIDYGPEAWRWIRPEVGAEAEATAAHGAASPRSLVAAKAGAPPSAPSSEPGPSSGDKSQEQQQGLSRSFEGSDGAWGDLKVILRLVLCAPFHRVTVHVLPPYAPSPREVENPRLFADNVRALVQAAVSRGRASESAFDSAPAGRCEKRCVVAEGREKGVLLGCV
jgi:1-acyl-sn-glycerol-3-phosphate acyltransferase